MSPGLDSSSLSSLDTPILFPCSNKHSPALRQNPDALTFKSFRPKFWHPDCVKSVA